MTFVLLFILLYKVFIYYFLRLSKLVKKWFFSFLFKLLFQIFIYSFIFLLYSLKNIFSSFNYLFYMCYTYLLKLKLRNSFILLLNNLFSDFYNLITSHNFF